MEWNELLQYQRVGMNFDEDSMYAKEITDILDVVAMWLHRLSLRERIYGLSVGS